MKKLLTFTTVGALLTAPAAAVQKCVALDASTTTCTSTSTNWNGKAEWEATCTTNDTSVLIKGVSACSNVKGDASYAVYSDGALPMVSSATDTTNVNCWCKMVEPAVSSWVFIRAYSSAGDCAIGCSFYCAGNAQYYPAFRSALFGSLTN